MTEETCDYHPKKAAKDKCSKCNKLICLRCKDEVTTHHRSGSGNYAKGYTSKDVYCIPCKHERILEEYESSKSRGKFLLVMGVLTIPFLFGFFVLWMRSRILSKFPPAIEESSQMVEEHAKTITA